MLGSIDFSTGDFSQCTSEVIGGSDALSIVSASGIMSGNNCMKFVSGGSNVSTYITKTFASQSTVYARCNIYIDPAFSTQNSTGTSEEIFGLHDSTGTPIIFFTLGKDNAPYRWFHGAYKNNAGTIVKTVECTIPTGLHTLEVYWTAGSGANGACGFYLDGYLFASYTGLAINNNIVSNVYAGSIPYQGGFSNSNSILYFGNIRVDTAINDLTNLVSRDYQNSGTILTNYYFGYQSDRLYQSTSFIAGSSYALSAVMFPLYFASNIVAQVFKLDIFSDNGSGAPLTKLATSLNSFAMNNFTTGQYFGMVFNFSPINLVNGTKYHLVIYPDVLNSTGRPLPLTNNAVTGQSMYISANESSFSLRLASAQNNFTTYATLVSNNFLKQGFLSDQSGVSGASIYN